MDIKFERLKLYEEVWTTPLTSLSKKYGLSDNGLRKVCKAMNIPLPRAGHWARLRAGQAVEKIPLPANAARTTFVSSVADRDWQIFKLPEDDKWLAEMMAFEAHPDQQIVCDLHPRRWHSVVGPMRTALQDILRGLEADRRTWERRQRQPRANREPMFDGMHWLFFEQSGQVIGDTQKASPMRVTPRTYERALAVLNCLCLQSERRGFHAGLTRGGERIELAGHGAKIQVRISERLTEEWRAERITGNSQPQNVKHRVPSGELRLYVHGSSYTESEFADEPERPLENKLNFVFERIYRLVVRSWADDRETADRIRREREEFIRRQEDAQRRHEETRRKEEELQRRRSLVEESAVWHKATLVRQYVAHLGKEIDRSPVVNAFSSFQEWTAWALAVADELDPTRRALEAFDRLGSSANSSEEMDGGAPQASASG